MSGTDDPLAWQRYEAEKADYLERKAEAEEADSIARQEADYLQRKAETWDADHAVLAAVRADVRPGVMTHEQLKTAYMQLDAAFLRSQARVMVLEDLCGDAWQEFEDHRHISARTKFKLLLASNGDPLELEGERYPTVEP